ncbi:MAG: ATP-binding protein [Azonexus sp.]
MPMISLRLFQGSTRQTWLWPDSHGCPEERADRLEQAQQAERARLNLIDQARCRDLACAGLTGLLERATFQRFSPRADWPEAIPVRDRVWDYAESVAFNQLGDRPWLILHGNYGTGKSHLAAAIIHRALGVGLRGCAFRVWTAYLSRLQATMDKKRQTDDEFGHETQADILFELKRGAVVVIDDIDKQPATEWARAKLFDVLNTRYNALLPTVITFNTSLTDPAIQDYIGGAVLDRIMQHAFDVIEFNGPSYRMVMA